MDVRGWFCVSLLVSTLGQPMLKEFIIHLSHLCYTDEGLQGSSMDPIMVKAWELFKHYYLARRLVFFYVILDGGALQIVTTIFMKCPNWNRFGHFNEGIKEQALLFRSFSASHVRNEANSTSHLLAKAASTQVLDDV